MTTYYTRGSELISQERSGAKSYYLYDGFDSVRMLTDNEGVVTDTYTFDAFGNLINSTGDTENSYLYRGEQFDSFTGLYYLRARYMNLSTGTFITMDEYAGSVFEPVSLHKYLYANANPVMFSDPSGYSAVATLPEQTAVIGIMGVLTAAVIVPCFSWFAESMALWLTDICDYCVIKANDVVKWAEGMLNGTITSASVANDVKEENSNNNAAVDEEPSEDKIGHLLDGAKPGRKTKGKSEQYEKDGDMSTANDDFDSLNPSNVKDIPGGRTGELDNGVRVNVRDHSSETSITLEIQYPNGRRIKIRYK